MREMLATPDVPWLGETCTLCGAAGDVVGAGLETRLRLFDLTAAVNEVRSARGAARKTMATGTLALKVVANAFLATCGACWRLLRGAPIASVKRSVSDRPKQD